eukprot:TRINITY_DN31011_c0_g1_i1.p1 TRINITY_DN31011_c0_g1~~TRINITY_DN31011_c0_g1_i1.p1  ORF type:complete len:523 (+),score=161.22 TRINITY_DN31011_c0_g1_i1:61-1569(+)
MARPHVSDQRGDPRDVWWRPSPQDMPKYFYPSAAVHPGRPMVKKTVHTEKRQVRPDAFATRDFARRLNKQFHRLSDLRNYISQQFDPNRSGLIGLGDFMCLWFKNYRLRHHRSYAAQLRVMDKPQPPRAAAAHREAVAAVAAALAARTLQVEQRNVESGRRPAQPRPWWGDADDEADGGVAAAWRGPHGRRAVARERVSKRGDCVDTAVRHDADGDWVSVTPGMLVRLRQLFDRYNENDGSNPSDVSMHIRFGHVAHFLQTLRCDETLGPFFAMTHLEIGRFLNDLVRHTNETMAAMRSSAAGELSAVRDVAAAAEAARCAGDVDSDLDWESDEDRNMAAVLEAAKEAVLRGGASADIMQGVADTLREYQTVHRPPPFFEEPTFVFSCVFALLVKHMVPRDGGGEAPGQDEVIGFFNQGVRFFHVLIGESPSGAAADTLRVLQVRVLLREFAHLEISRPGSTAFNDAHLPTFAGPRAGRYQEDDTPRRQVAGHGEIGTGAPL